MPVANASTIQTITELREVNNIQYQNSERGALPLNSAYFRKLVEIASVKFILIYTPQIKLIALRVRPFGMS